MGFKAATSFQTSGRQPSLNLESRAVGVEPFSSRHFPRLVAAGRAHSRGGDVRASGSARLDCARRIAVAHRRCRLQIFCFLQRS